MLLNCGVKAVYYVEGYDDPLATAMVEESGVVFTKLDYSKRGC